MEFAGLVQRPRTLESLDVHKGAESIRVLPVWFVKEVHCVIIQGKVAIKKVVLPAM
jgi:hypothetical protein